MKQELESKLRAIANEVVDLLVEKDPAYGSSWKAHGGFSAFFNLHRKYSRVENMAEQHQFDLFEAVATFPDGPDSLKDLIGYALLTLSETYAPDPEVYVEVRLKQGSPFLPEDYEGDAGPGYVDQDREG